MYLKTLTLAQFKSYQEAHFEFSEGVNVFFGANGAGKTNLLDAIHFLAMTRSYFGLSDQQLIRISADFFRVSGTMHKHGLDHTITMKMRHGQRKIIEHGAKVLPRALDHIGTMPCVMIAPGDLVVVDDNHAERRALADSSLAFTDRSYLDAMVAYNRLLKQRNAALKDWLENRKWDADLISSYDGAMAGPATRIFEGRRAFFADLLRYVREAYSALSDGKESIDIHYQSALISSSWEDLIRGSTTRDKMMGRTTAGIHRDTIDCLIDGKDARIYASQGQKKSLVFALKLGQWAFIREQLRYYPLLLLDDIFDRLDSGRVERLMALILDQAGAQLFITDTQWDRIGRILESRHATHARFDIEQFV